VGNEANCVVTFGKQKARGKALLETSDLIFRSEDGALRLKFSFSGIKSAAAVGGQLRLEVPEGTAAFELGANAAKWCEKILHPKTRIEKLGIKPNATVSLVGNFDSDFLAELRAVTKTITDGKAAPGTEWIFFAANSSKDYRKYRHLRRA
jgi:hypothetical protein